MSYDPQLDEPPWYLAPIFSTAAGMFGAAAAVRRALYRTHVLGTERVKVPVISVGNIMVGGSGKTPFTALLAAKLSAENVAIVSRGYGRRDRSKRLVVVSRGDGPIARVESAGDEPYWLATATNAQVLVSADRVLGAKHAIQELGAEVILLDDGFQHLRLHRDLDIVLLDALHPFGNGRLLPRGPLREGRLALKRAGLLVVNHGAERRGDGDPAIAACGVPMIHVCTEADATVPLAGRRIAILTAIARPDRVARTAERLGAEVVHRTDLADHAWFDTDVLDDFEVSAANADAELLVTTEKDAVRLPDDRRGSFEVIRIRHTIVEGASVLDDLLTAVRTRVSSAAVG